MPNYCSNSLTLTHADPTQIARAVAAYKADQMLNEFVPCPPELLKSSGWYHWCIFNWGTKWDVCHHNIDPDVNATGTSAKFSFDSAWSPPVAWYRCMVNLGFEVTAYWHEPGMAFCGKFADGSKESYDIQGNSDWVDANIPADINEAMCIAENMRVWEDDNEDTEDNEVVQDEP
jgi:hypothetical protein